MSRNNVAFSIGTIIPELFRYCSRMYFKAHKVCHILLNVLLPKVFLNHQDSGWSRDQPQPGSLPNDKGSKVEPGSEVISECSSSLIIFQVLQYPEKRKPYLFKLPFALFLQPK